MRKASYLSVKNLSVFGGYIFLVSQRLEGSDLLTIINNDLIKNPTVKRALSLELRSLLTIKLLQALPESITNNKLIHYDVKPKIY